LLQAESCRPLKIDSVPSSLSPGFHLIVPYPTRLSMLSLFREPAKDRVAGAFLMLLAIGSIAPSRAQASCGNNVTSTVLRSNPESYSTPRLIGHFAKHGDVAPAGRRRDVPCTGPTCSRGRGSSTVPSIPVRISDPRRCTTVAFCSDDQSSTPKPTDVDLLHARHNSSPPERPPRNPEPPANS
jgi:hypothetical protein